MLTQILNFILKEAYPIASNLTQDTAGLALLTAPDLDVPYYTTAPVPSTYRTQPAFLSQSPEAIHEAFLRLTAPLDGRPSLWCTQAYVILDGATAAAVADEQQPPTMLLVAETARADGSTVVERVRANVDVALAHLVPAELGYVSFTDVRRSVGAEDDANVVLTWVMLKRDVEEHRRRTDDLVGKAKAEEEEGEEQ